MANEMIKFYKGLEASLPAAGTNGALYITTDEGAIYLGTGTGMKRLGDFIQVANVDALPAKAHENCLYYCVAENILAKWNGVEWKQVNKQPTTDELKTLLGLGTMAYKSEVAEADLNSELKAKVNAAAEGNHSHENKTVLDGITAEKVAAWDAAEGNAKTHADTEIAKDRERIEALEAVDHEHANKTLLDTYTQTEADLADAVTKKHAHTFNETELNKIVEGDVAKWNGVAADHLTSADKATLDNDIKEAKKAGTDANTNVETYKVTNDARVLAVEEDIAEITNANNGILAQAKTYSDGKLATARTEITAEIDADVKVVSDALGEYKTSNDAALAGVKATAEAAATKTYTDEELGKKVDKVTGKSLVDDAEITKLAGVSTGANKVEASETNGNIKVDGVETVVYTHPEKHAIAEVDGLQAALDGKQAAGDYATEVHTHVKADITDFAHTHTASEVTDLDDTIKGYDYATKAEAQAMADGKDAAIEAAQDAADKAQGEVDALETYVGTFTASEGVDTVVKYIDAKTANIASDETVRALTDRVEQAEKDIDAIEADYLKAEDKTELSNAIGAEKTRAEGIEAGLRTDVDAIKGDYLKGEDKTALEGKITAEEDRAKGVEESLQTQINTIMNNPDAEGAINSINEFTKYVIDHGTIADGFRADIDENKKNIAANAKAIEDQATSDASTYETKVDATAKLTEAKEYADGLNTAMDTRVKVLEAIDHEAYKTADAELATAIETAKTEASNQDAVVLAEAQAYADQAEADAIADAEGKVNALASNVYTKTQTYTQDEVDSAIEAAVTSACSWGEF